MFDTALQSKVVEWMDVLTIQRSLGSAFGMGLRSPVASKDALILQSEEDAV